MFHSAALKLTGWYLAIIMALSIGCSLVIYHFSSSELGRPNSRGQYYILNNDLAPLDYENFMTLRSQQVNESRENLKSSLVVFNILVLVLGGGVSYILARRTLLPIEDALEAQKRFSADASHELRTPLTAMQSEIEVALRDPKITKAEAVALLGSNLEEVGKLRNLSEGLLKLANHDGKTQAMEPVSLQVVTRAAAERLAKAAHTKKIKINEQLRDVTAIGDRQNLTDLVAILLDNAIKYSPAGSNVKLTCGRRAKQAFLEVTDQGQGIAADDLPRIFERFYRAEQSRTKNQADGYGLGLALARKITEMHKGHLEVRSTPAKGSVFTVYLPLA